MFGFLKRRKENKLLEETIEIIGKALILEGFNSENAIKIASVSMDILLKNIREIDGDPWILAVRGMHLLRLELNQADENEDDTKAIIDVLGKVIRLSHDNAYSNASTIDILILDAVYRAN